MKPLMLGTVVGLSLLLLGCNQQAEQAAAPAAPGTFSATGELTVVNQDTVMIDHGEIVELDWPAMTMTYEVPNPAMVANLQAGEQVRFSFKREGFGYVLTDIAQQ
jgi:Cu(I)/Ag(I) efflux system membrane fusion protein